MSTVLALTADDTHRELLEWSLDDGGRDLVRVGSLRELEAALGRGGADVVVVDRDALEPGGEALSRCLDLPRIGEAEVLVLVAHADLRALAQRFALASVDFVAMPIRAGELTVRVEAALRRQARAQLLEQHVAELRREGRLLVRQARDLEADRDALVGIVETLPQREVLLRLDGEGLVAEILGGDAAGFAALSLCAGRKLAEQGEAGERLEAVLGRLRRAGPPRQLVWAGRTFDVERLAIAEGAGSWVRLTDATRVRRVLRAREQRALAAGGLGRRQETTAIRGFVGRAASVRDLVERVARLRDARTTVLIQGESGTGKELIARSLHFGGPQARRPFVPIHCGAISRDLIESELFGYEKGAFTGAHAAQQGLFEAADGGTVFLDEVGETSLAVQVKLLRVLQTGEIRPVGATQPRHVDVRVIAATNTDLAQQVAAGTFREDLFYRLAVVELPVPPLRERLEDLPLLIDHFVHRFHRGRPGPPVRGVSRAAMDLLEAYPWPGNVRELENALAAAFALGAGEIIQVDDLPARLRGAVRRPAAPRPVADERAIRDALRRAGGDKARAAELLGISRATLYRRLREGEAGA